jgi:hypothetical protein
VEEEYGLAHGELTEPRARLSEFKPIPRGPDGNVIIGELVRNMEVGRFEMAYTVLMPCVFTIYLNPEDFATLSGVFDLVVEDARRALRARVSELNRGASAKFGFRRRAKARKEYKIACRDWDIEFLPDSEVPQGDVEIHSELNEVAEPGFRGTKTTLMDRTPTATAKRSTTGLTPRRSPEGAFAELRYEDDSGPQVYQLSQNRVNVGRGGGDQPMDLPLYTSDEVSREHLVIRRDPATGLFFITDSSTNGTWLDGKRLRKGVEEVLPHRAEIGVGEVLTMAFEARG